MFWEGALEEDVQLNFLIRLLERLLGIAGCAGHTVTIEAAHGRPGRRFGYNGAVTCTAAVVCLTARTVDFWQVSICVGLEFWWAVLCGCLHRRWPPMSPPDPSCFRRRRATRWS